MRSAIGRNHQEVLLVDLVEIADLSGIDRRQTKVAHERPLQRVKEATTMREHSIVSKALANASFAQRHASSSLSTTSRKLRRSSCAPGGRLHDAVGVVARHSGIDEGEEHGLGEDGARGSRS